MSNNKRTVWIARLSQYVKERLAERSTRLALTALGAAFGVVISPEAIDLVLAVAGGVATVSEALLPDNLSARVAFNDRAREMQANIQRLAETYGTGDSPQSERVRLLLSFCESAIKAARDRKEYSLLELNTINSRISREIAMIMRESVAQQIKPDTED